MENLIGNLGFFQIIENLFSKYLKGYTKPVIAFKLTKYLLENDGFDEGMFVTLRKVIHYFDWE